MKPLTHTGSEPAFHTLLINVIVGNSSIGASKKYDILTKAFNTSSHITLDMLLTPTLSSLSAS